MKNIMIPAISIIVGVAIFITQNHKTDIVVAIAITTVGLLNWAIGYSCGLSKGFEIKRKYE